MASLARAAVVVALGCTGLVGVGAGTAHAVMPYTCTPQQALSPDTVQPGDTVTDVLTCFTPFDEITGVLFSRPRHLFDVTADANGSATVTFQVPQDVCGDHTVVARGDSGETVSTPITITGCRNRHDDGRRVRRDRPCDDWRDPSFWFHNCDTADRGWETGFDAAYTAPLPAHHSSDRTMAGVVGLGLVGPALLGGGVLIARRRAR
jgi:hypothetical protein